MPTKTVPWDSSAALRSNEEIAAYIDAVLEDGDPTLLAHALGIVARTKGMTDLAKETGMGREVSTSPFRAMAIQVSRRSSKY